MKVKTKSAFSLLEVIVGIFVVTIVVGSISASFILQEKAFKKYRDQNMLRFVAESEMERLLSAGFDEISGSLVSYPHSVQVERLIDNTVIRVSIRVDASFSLRSDGETGEILIRVTNDREPPKTIELRSAIYKTS